MYFCKHAITGILSLVLGVHAFLDVTGEHWLKRLAIQNNVTVADDHHVPTGYFKQWIDHDDHSKGTFRQRYYYHTEWYKGPGSPIVFTTPGESSLAYSQFFFQSDVIIARFAQEIGAAIVIIEHRYFGKSIPYGRPLNAETLQQHTLKNALLDFQHFARAVEFPFDKDGKSQAPKTPWVFTGGSYAGALVAWTEQLYPGTFWAYHASSAVVQAIDHFWQYFDVMEKHSIPKKCVSDLQLSVNYIDRVFKSGSHKDVQKVKRYFGMDGLKNGDFAGAIVYPLYYYQNQQNRPFCDSLAKGRSDAIKNGTSQALGAVKGYGKYIIHSSCIHTRKCYDTYRKKKPAITIAGKSWGWMLCNEPFAWWRVREPVGQQGIVPNALTAEDSQHQCKSLFPTYNGYTFGSNRGKTVQDTNAFTGGFNHRRPSKRLAWHNSGYDPWRGATVSSPYREGGPQRSTKEEPIFFTPEGYHVSDYIPCPKRKFGKHACQIVNREIAQITKWVKEFPQPY